MTGSTVMLLQLTANFVHSSLGDALNLCQHKNTDFVIPLFLLDVDIRPSSDE